MLQPSRMWFILIYFDHQPDHLWTVSDDTNRSSLLVDSPNILDLDVSSEFDGKRYQVLSSCKRSKNQQREVRINGWRDFTTFRFSKGWVVRSFWEVGGWWPGRGPEKHWKSEEPRGWVVHCQLGLPKDLSTCLRNSWLTSRWLERPWHTTSMPPLEIFTSPDSSIFFKKSRNASHRSSAARGPKLIWFSYLSHISLRWVWAPCLVPYYPYYLWWSFSSKMFTLSANGLPTLRFSTLLFKHPLTASRISSYDKEQCTFPGREMKVRFKRRPVQRSPWPSSSCDLAAPELLSGRSPPQHPPVIIPQILPWQSRWVDVH